MMILMLSNVLIVDKHGAILRNLILLPLLSNLVMSMMLVLNLMITMIMMLSNGAKSAFLDSLASPVVVQGSQLEVKTSRAPFAGLGSFTLVLY